MGASPVKWDAATAAARLRHRRRWRFAAVILTGFALLTSLVDHLRAQNRSGDDWLRFDAHQVQFVGAVGGQDIAIRDGSSDDVTVVRILGIKSFDARWDRAAASRIASLLAGRTLTLHLQSTQTPTGTDDCSRTCSRMTASPLPPNWPARVWCWLTAARPTRSGAIARFESQARRKGIGLWEKN